MSKRSSRTVAVARSLAVVMLLLSLLVTTGSSVHAQDDVAGTPAAFDEPADEVVVEATAEPTTEATTEPTTDGTSEPDEATVEANPGDGAPVGTPSDPVDESPVESGDEAEVSASGTNDLTLIVKDHTGAPLTGTCWNFYEEIPGITPDILIGEYCDSDDGADDGTVTVPAADYTADQLFYFTATVVPAGFPPGYRSNTIVTRVEFSEEAVLAPYADVVIYKVDENGDPLPGACFLLSRYDEVCDADDGADDGTIVFNDVAPQEPPRGYSIGETSAPAGYVINYLTLQISVYGHDVEVTFENTPEEDAGTIRVNKTDEGGTLLLGACFEIQTLGGVGLYAACDYDDDQVNFLDDGVTLFPEFAAGDYLLIETRSPDGYGESPERRRISVEAGEETVIDWENYAPASLTIRKVNHDGDLLPGACFIAWNNPDRIGSNVTSFCDYEDGAEDGLNTIFDAADGDTYGAGTYWIEEDQAPVGYAAPSELVEVTLEPGDNEITIVNKRLVTLTIYKQDENGDPLPGSCFALAPYPDFDLGDEVCDVDDGTDDGTIVIEDVLEGEYIWFETVTPAGYVTAFPTYVNLLQDNTIEVRNTLLADAATITVEKVDEHGDPLAGACFELYEGDLDAETGEPLSDVPVQEVCDADDGSDDGVISFDPVPVANQPLSNMVLVETVAPAGYKGGIIVEVQIETGENSFEIENEPTDGPDVTPSPTPSTTPTTTADDDEDDELDDVKELPSTGTGPSVLSVGSMAALWLLLGAAMLVGLTTRSRRRA